MDANTYRQYARDLGFLMVEAALEAKLETDYGDDYFLKGRAFAYYEVVGLMRDQAAAFQIPLEALALDALDPESLRPE